MERVAIMATLATTQNLAFQGSTVRLTGKDYERWRAVYNLIEDFDAALQLADDYYTANPPRDGKWFFPVSRFLYHENAKALKRRRDRERGDTWF
jgi:hypothetical protein